MFGFRSIARTTVCNVRAIAMSRIAAASDAPKRLDKDDLSTANLASLSTTDALERASAAQRAELSSGMKNAFKRNPEETDSSQFDNTYEGDRTAPQEIGPLARKLEQGPRPANNGARDSNSIQSSQNSAIVAPDEFGGARGSERTAYEGSRRRVWTGVAGSAEGTFASGAAAHSSQYGHFTGKTSGTAPPIFMNADTGGPSRGAVNEEDLREERLGVIPPGQRAGFRSGSFAEQRSGANVANNDQKAKWAPNQTAFLDSTENDGGFGTRAGGGGNSNQGSGSGWSATTIGVAAVGLAAIAYAANAMWGSPAYAHSSDAQEEVKPKRGPGSQTLRSMSNFALLGIDEKKAREIAEQQDKRDRDFEERLKRSSQRAPVKPRQDSQIAAAQSKGVMDSNDLAARSADTGSSSAASKFGSSSKSEGLWASMGHAWDTTKQKLSSVGDERYLPPLHGERLSDDLGILPGNPSSS